jgi:hypothetical protein
MSWLVGQSTTSNHATRRRQVLFSYLTQKFPERPFGPTAPPSQVDAEVRMRALQYYTDVARTGVVKDLKRYSLLFMATAPWASSNDKAYAAMAL